jgi:hypothetical protein
MKKLKIKIILWIIICPVFICNNLQGQSKKTYVKGQAETLRRLRDSVEKNPDNLALNRKLIYAWGGVGTVDSTLIIQYDRWLTKFPKSSVMPFAIGQILGNYNNINADKFLLRAVSLNPKLAEAWFLLYKDAAAKADTLNACEYLEMAVKTEPEDNQYAFFDAYQYRYTNPSLFRSMALNLAKRFIGNQDETGINAVSVLIWDEKDEKNKIAYYDLIKDSYIKYRGYWYNILMTDYFEHMLTINPGKSLEIAAQLKNLPLNVELAKTMIRVKELLQEQKVEDADSLLRKVQLKNSAQREHFTLFKAQVADAANRTQSAFDSIAYSYSKKPTDTLQKAMLLYGNKLGFTYEDIKAKIKKMRDSVAKQVGNFSIYSYVTNKKVNLADYKGKVVLFTIWAPTLLNCREQAAIVDKILKKYNNNVVCIAVNPEPLMDGYILPYLKNTGYTFVPLRDTSGHSKGNIEPGILNINLFSRNFLIDQRGRIMFSNFDAINPNNQHTLELMIDELLENNNTPLLQTLADSTKRGN